LQPRPRLPILFFENGRTPTTPSLRRGQTERYGPMLIGRAEACEGGFQVRNALPAQNASHYRRLLVSVQYVSQLEAASTPPTLL
jgi:hypothetical protein